VLEAFAWTLIAGKVADGCMVNQFDGCGCFDAFFEGGHGVGTLLTTYLAVIIHYVEGEWNRVGKIVVQELWGTAKSA